MEVDLVEQGNGSCAESMFRELINARTPVEMLSAINDLIQDQEDDSGDQLVQADARESTRLQKLIIRPGDAGGDEAFSHGLNFCLQSFVLIKRLKKKTS